MGLLGKIYPIVLTGLEVFLSSCRKIPIIGTCIDIFTSNFVSLINLYAGYYSNENNRKVEEPFLKLYSYVGCPFCRKVDIILSTLALDAEYFSCPRTTFKTYGSIEGSRFRNNLIKIGGKAQFPFLIDEKTNKKIYESDDIVEYLIKNYKSNNKNLPKNYIFSTKFGFLNFIRNIFRCLKEDGLMKIPSKKSKKMVLWGKVGSYDSLKARETLTSLEINYIFRTIPIGANEKIKYFKTKFKKYLNSNLFEPSILEDNENIIVGGYNISSYLNKKYKIGKVSSESYLNFSTKGSEKGHAVF